MVTDLQDWLPLVACKQAAYHGMAEFYQGCVAQQHKTYGEQIAHFQVHVLNTLVVLWTTG